MGIKSRYREKSPEEIPASEKIEVEPVKSNPAALPNADEASQRIKRQIADLHQAEAVQRLWGLAQNAASQHGYQPGTAEHQQAANQILSQHLASLQDQRPPQPTPEPEPFRPQQSVALPQEPDRSSHYSAPVSREVASGGDGRRSNPSQVRLSVQQKEAALLAGISEVEYARQLGKLPEWKRVRGVETE